MKHKIFIIAPIIVATVLVIVWLCVGRPLSPEVPDDETQQTETEEYYVPPLVGDSEISEERKPLLDENIMDVIERAGSKIPMVDEDGNIVTDESGNIVMENVETPDYSNVKENLIVIVNAFADRGYSEESIALVQRFYFRYYDILSEYSSSDLIEKLTSCFSATENVKSELCRTISAIFGLYRDDEFAFLFEESLPPADIKALFFEVKPTVKFEWSDELERHCIYSAWFAQNGDAVHDRHLEDYLHTIVYRMNRKDASPFDIRLAQLIYCAYVSDAEYRADGIDLLIDAVTAHSDDFDDLKFCILELFDVNIYSNRIIPSYYAGITEFNEGVRDDG